MCENQGPMGPKRQIIALIESYIEKLIWLHYETSSFPVECVHFNASISQMAVAFVLTGSDDSLYI